MVLAAGCSIPGRSFTCGSSNSLAARGRGHGLKHYFSGGRLCNQNAEVLVCNLHMAGRLRVPAICGEPGRRLTLRTWLARGRSRSRDLDPPGPTPRCHSHFHNRFHSHCNYCHHYHQRRHNHERELVWTPFGSEVLPPGTGDGASEGPTESETV